MRAAVAPSSFSTISDAKLSLSPFSWRTIVDSGSERSNTMESAAGGAGLDPDRPLTEIPRRSRAST